MLGEKVPYSILFLKDLVCVPPEVFGGVCFVNLFPVDKMALWAVKCIFLGYSRTQERYRCYDPTTHRSYIIANVTFCGCAMLCNCREEY